MEAVLTPYSRQNRDKSQNIVSVGRGSMRIAKVLWLAAVLACAVHSFAQGEGPFRDGTVLVRFGVNTTPNQRASVVASIMGKEEVVIGQDVHVLKVPEGKVQQIVEALNRRPEVKYAEPDFRQVVSGSPNDAKFSLQWGFRNTGQIVNGVTGTAGADEAAVAAWDVSTGSRNVVVAVLDTGINYNHEDLAANVWSNPGGINGCVAGTHGFNVLNDTCDPMDDDTSYSGHGSHVAGIIGAVTNNAVGVAGVNWQASLLAVKWVSSNGTGYTSDLIKAMDWVIKAKNAGVNIRVANDSPTWSGTAVSQALSDEIDLLGTNDILFVAAAGNTSQNNDTTPRYPCSYTRPNEICVAASDQDDELASFSNYGSKTVDLAAPGKNIYSTLKGSTSYGYISGCSMSAAQVSGAAALILSQGYKSVSDLKATIVNAVDLLPAFASTTRTGGRLNLCKALAGCMPTAPVNTALPVISGTATQGQTLSTSNGSWTGGPTTYAYEWDRCDSSGSNCSQIEGATTNTYTLAAADVGSTIRSTVTASNSVGSTSATSTATAVVDSSGSGITRVQSAAAQGTNVRSVTTAFPGANTAGDLIIAFVRASTTTQYVAVSDSRGNSYVEAVRQAQTSDGHQIRIFYARNVAGGSNAVTASFSGTNGHPSLSVFEYSGFSGTVSLDRTAGAQGRSTQAASAPTAQTTSPNELVFAGLGLPSSSKATVTSGSGYTLVQQITSGSRFAAEDRVVSALGSFTGTFNLSASANWSAVVATFSASVSSPAISTSSLPEGTVGSAYSAALTVTGGTGPFSWSVASGTLPAGLSLSANTGVISGTPTSSGTSNFVVQVTDANSSTATKALSITVAPPSSSPIALVQSAAATGTSVASLSKAFATGNTAGNLIVVFVRMSSTTQTVTVTDTAGNVYENAVSQVQSSDGHQVHVFYAKNIDAGANTVQATFSATNNHPWIAIYEYSGLSTTAPLDQTAHAQGSSTTPNSGLTPMTASASELVFAGLGLPATSTVSASAGTGFNMLLQDAGTSRSATEARITGSTGQYAGTFSLSGSTNWTSVVAVFKP